MKSMDFQATYHYLHHVNLHIFIQSRTRKGLVSSNNDAMKIIHILNGKVVMQNDSFSKILNTGISDANLYLPCLV